jgi:hypothetical protein
VQLTQLALLLDHHQLPHHLLLLQEGLHLHHWHWPPPASVASAAAASPPSDARQQLQHVLPSGSHGWGYPA